jgi:hypothetical protein
MPCNDGGWPGRASGYEQNAEAAQLKLDDVTRMLCETCKLIEKHHPDSETQTSAGAIPGLRAWWDEHKRRDALRLAQEAADQAAKDELIAAQALREAAMNKLTDEERKVLGL